MTPKRVIAAGLAALLVGCVTSEVRPPAEPALEIRQIADGVWLHTSWHTLADGSLVPSNGLIVREGGALTLVDTAWGVEQTAALLASIDERFHLPVMRAIVTHAHEDRVAGVDLLESRGIEVVAHPLTQRLARERGLPVPDRIIEGIVNRGESVASGELEIFYPGAAHAPDNIMVWVPAAQLLFGGCAIRADAARSAGNLEHADPASWLRALDLVGRRYPSARIVVPGHGDPGGPGLIAHSAELVTIAQE